LGNLEAHSDWGHAEDYVREMWLMLQQPNASDYVIATNETHSIRDFLNEAFNYIGINDWNNLVVQDPEFYRPSEVDYLLGKATKANTMLGWIPNISFKKLVQRMVNNDINEAKL
jgi:GDPmannose 4,6-dehydratase